MKELNLNIEHLFQIIEQSSLAGGLGLVLWFVLHQFKRLQDEICSLNRHVLRVVEQNTDAQVSLREAFRSLELKVGR